MDECEVLNKLGKHDIDIIDEFTLNGRTFLGRVIDVIDGDTLIIIMNTNGYYYRYHVRLNGIDVCELHGDLQHESKRIRTMVLRFLLNQGDCSSSNDDVVERPAIRNALLETPCIVTVVCHKFDKYGRLLADVNRSCDGVCISSFLLNQGFAKPYTGGTKPTHSKENVQ